MIWAVTFKALHTSGVLDTKTKQCVSKSQETFFHGAVRHTLKLQSREIKFKYCLPIQQLYDFCQKYCMSLSSNFSNSLSGFLLITSTIRLKEKKQESELMKNDVNCYIYYRNISIQLTNIWKYVGWQMWNSAVFH